MKSILRILLQLIYIIVLFIPAYTFFIATPGNWQSIIRNTTPEAILFTLFRLFGLYAITLIWLQLMIGSFMPYFTSIFGGKLLKFHMTQGIFILLFTLLHPLLFYISFYLGGSTTNILFALAEYIGGSYIVYAYLGPVAFTIMVITVITARLRTHPLLQRYWRYIHFGNYLVFLFAFLHSFNIGSDVRTEPMQTLYYIYGITFVIALFYRFGYKRLLPKLRTKIPQTTPVPPQSSTPQ